MNNINMNNAILLVEDNLSDEIFAMLALGQADLADYTKIVRDGQEALDYIFYEGAYADRPVNIPQVILLDLKLPKVDGLEVLKRIRENEKTKLLPVIILTSSKDEKDIAKAEIHGANRYLQKPVELQSLKIAINYFLTYYAGMTKNLE